MLKMPKICVITTVLFLMVTATACVNNFAVQELNNKAKVYLEKGDTEAAVSRLEASIDLDGSLYETYYNLSVAYIKAEKYEKAVKTLNKTLELKPDFYDAYYSLGSAYENNAEFLIKKYEEELESEAQNACEPVKTDEKIDLTDAQKTEILDNFSKALDNYNMYLTKRPDAADKANVESLIEYIQKEMEKYNSSQDEQKSVNE